MFKEAYIDDHSRHDSSLLLQDVWRPRQWSTWAHQSANFLAPNRI